MRHASVTAAGLLVLALALAPAAGQAQEQACSTEGACELLLPVGAMGMGVARAMTALGGTESVWWNPAGLGRVASGAIQVTRGEDIAGETTTLTGLYHRPGFGTFGASYLLMDLGEVVLTDTEGNSLGRVSYRFHTGVLSGATLIRGRLALGMNLKLIQSRLRCRGECLDAGVTATTYGVDLGAQWTELLGLPVTLGAAVVHAGPRLQVVNEAQADPLPTRMRFGAAYDVLAHWAEAERFQARALLVAEVEDRWRNPGSPAVYVATELAALRDPSIALRAGYAFGRELQVDGAGVGIGIGFERFELGISKSLASSALAGETDPVNITFGYVFR